jgi:hypothetical protein
MNPAIKNHKNIVVYRGSHMAPCALIAQLHAITNFFFYVLFTDPYARRNLTRTALILEQFAHIPVPVRTVAKNG